MMNRLIVFLLCMLLSFYASSAEKYKHEKLRINAVSLSYYNPVISDQSFGFYPGWKAGAETFIYVDRKIREKENQQLVFEDYIVLFGVNTGGYLLPSHYFSQFLQSEIIFRYISNLGIVAGTTVGVGFLKKIYFNGSPNTVLGSWYLFPSFGILTGYDFKRKFRKPFTVTFKACIAPVGNDHMASLEAGVIYRIK